ncbi:MULTISPECIES: hypothetical protein [Brevibacillus]|uniref:DUF3846 domain-containing protein n=1 Tax=Brevibacillus TaxID=55080 RepID=UPI00054F84FA|nr:MULTISPECIES: hypothetical protein [Brevibacillus]UYZ11683.1 hypothetical protein A6764_12555 [Brevibacillus sp. WF146]
MITVLIKRPHEEAEPVAIAGADELSELVGGDYDVVRDDRLPGFSLIVNEEARGIEANNFPVTTDGYLDWVYGTCVFVKEDGTSLTEEDVETVRRYLAAKS